MAAPLENTNSEKWDIETAESLFDEALKLSFEKDYDFIGEVARELKTYRDIFTYLSDKFPQLKPKYKSILSNLEANCFSHGKTNQINTAIAIVNLKSNHGWTDRNNVEVKGDIKTTQIDYAKLSDQALQEIANLNNDTK